MSEIEEVKARLDLVEFIQGYVPLNKAGRNYKGLCPFHTEKTPSFVVFPESQHWRCFGCGEGGDIFTFAMKQEGWDFREALEHLAERAGVELKPRRNEPQQIEQYDRLRALLTEAAAYYHGLLLNAPEAEFARRYVAGRKLDDGTVRAFVLGYAPNSWDATRKYLQSKGYAEEEIIAAGLVVVREEEGKRYDRFRHRLMIPIRDERGQTVGFGARALDPDAKPKYLNSPQNALFDKSRILYGLDMSRRAIRETETAVLVEGYMDVMQAHQHGFRNLVAQMGTALTETQLAQLARYARRLILALDPDAAGMTATLRDLEVARSTLTEQYTESRRMILAGGLLNIDIRVLSLPAGKDPDALIRDRPDEWRQRLEAAAPVAEYVIRRAVAGRDIKDAFERERIAHELLPVLYATESEVQNYSNVQALARALDIPEKTLIAWANSQPRPPVHGGGARPAEPARPAERNGAQEPVQFSIASTLRQERSCLAVLIQRPELIYTAARRLQETGLPRLCDRDFTDPGLQEIFRAFERALAQDALSPVDYMHETLPPVLAEALDDFLQKELPGDLDDTRDVQRALYALLRLRKNYLQRRLGDARALQSEVLEIGDLTRAAELETIINLHSQELGRLEKVLPYDRNAVKLF